VDPETGQPLTLAEVMRANRQPEPRRGPDLFIVPAAKGRDLDGIKHDARWRARQFYGYEADLVIEHVGPVYPRGASSCTEFTAQVEVRCVNFTDLHKEADQS
jgi:hypothetical protein